MASHFEFRHQGYCDICDAKVEFFADQRWFRDYLVCPLCKSVPRERALMQVLKRYYPDYQQKRIHESSPGGRGVSVRLGRECKHYSYSHYFPDTPPGTINTAYKARCESLEALTFPNGAFDLIITQDVMEHVLDPEAAFREIGRVLRPGGAHIFTVPLVRKTEASRPRAQRLSEGTIDYLLPAEYHGNPVDNKGSLVTMDWGYDIVTAIQTASGMSSQIIYTDDLDRGIRAEFIDVVVSFRR
ncbi:MAG: class I SAM-dependent methyltransferase [Hyphomonas sp.]